MRLFFHFHSQLPTPPTGQEKATPASTAEPKDPVGSTAQEKAQLKELQVSFDEKAKR